MFMENKDNESLKLSAKMVDLEDAEEFLKGSSAGKEKIRNAASNKGTERFFTEVTATKEREKICVKNTSKITKAIKQSTSTIL